MMVANAAVSLGMEVEGFDPYISVGRAWELSREVKRAENLEKMLSRVDYLSLHVPLSKDTKNLIDVKKLKLMKKGAVILNFSRGELVSDEDIISALNEGKIAKYITDFPNAALVSAKNVICIPHLGASTKEAEVNCAMMIADQIMDFLENGNIKNSVNFPECSLDRQGDARLIVGNSNVPNMVGQITTILAEEGLNILNMVNKSKGDIAYNIIDISGKISPSVIKKIKAINGIIMDRLIM
jgi:D-3-phosphoglycerate dehydrogenase